MSKVTGLIKSGIRPSSVTARLVRAYNLADAAARIDGGIWYENAMQFTADLSERTDTRIDTTAAVIAALSPQCSWSANKLAAEQLLTDGTRRAGLLVSSYERGKSCLVAEDPTSKLTGPKIAAFCENILGDTERVTVDSWAVRAALGSRVNHELILRRVGVYDDIANCYRSAAALVGETPRELQAIIWCAIRGKSN